MRKTLIHLSIAILLSLTVSAQQLSRDQIIEALERDGCVTLDQKKIKICKYDYVWQGKKVEGVIIRPLAEARYPGLLLLPGRVAATSFITLGMIFAGQGFACLSVAEPGFGKSEGKPDFMGPNSINAFAAGFKNSSGRRLLMRLRWGFLATLVEEWRHRS
ncbi:MAG TPA: hypothetical protein VJ372_14810 [Pyrinomonadaceae bacterium]|nr:hypothetical protein [Pyrinomonadaceae bacterium]